MGGPPAEHGAPETDDDRRTLRALAMTGYGHFTTMLVTDRRVRGLDLHLRRLERDGRVLFGTGPDATLVRAMARVAAPGTGRTVVRVTVADPALGVATIGAAAAPRPMVTTRPAPAGSAPALRVRTAAHLRYLPEVKSVGLFATLHLRRRAVHDGFDDVLFTTDDGALLEGSTWNLGLVTGDRIVWPQGPVLAGTTRALLRRAVAAEGLPESGATVTVTDLGGCDAAFATSATGVRPIASIDGYVFDPAHPLLARLSRIHDALPATSL